MLEDCYKDWFDEMMKLLLGASAQRFVMMLMIFSKNVPTRVSRGFYARLERCVGKKRLL